MTGGWGSPSASRRSPPGSRLTTLGLSRPLPATQEYDATVLVRERGPFPFKVLVDQGTADKFLPGKDAAGKGPGLLGGPPYRLIVVLADGCRCTA
jgi:hypothetical protein